MLIGLQDFIAGWMGGTVALAIGHPFDTIKVRQQVLQTRLIPAITFTFRHERIRGFYKGFLFPSLMVGPSNAIFFGFYGGTMKYINPSGQDARVNLHDPHWMQHVFLAGCFAGFWQVLFTCPSEVVKTTLQMQTKHRTIWKAHYESKARGLLDCITKIWRGPGVLWYFRGITPMMYRDCPASGVYTFVYEYLAHYNYDFRILNHKLIKQSIAGGTAGVVSWVFVIPFDVVKSRMQGDNMNKPQFKSMYHCFLTTYRENGWRFFFAGSWPVIIRSFPFNVAVFVTYEFVMDTFKKLGYD